MTKLKEETLKIDALRHNEYYSMQEIYDLLYDQSKNRNVFNQLMDTITSRENILLAYRNIKSNGGSNTPGTDKLTIKNIGKLTSEEVVEKVQHILYNYSPRAVRRKEIPKPNGKTRPLGIPCIWDRLIQQCILQVLEPICEAKFSENSYGFRPNRSCEHAIAHAYRLMQQSKLRYVVEVDIEGFFDNVSHSKLLKQIWAMGIRDKKLLYVIRRILTAQILMPDGTSITPDKGTPQGGILSPLLANIVLNEFDHWIDSQWQENPLAVERGRNRQINGQNVFDKSGGYKLMKTTCLKEMYIVRYADDFRIFCRNNEDAQNTMVAVKQWLEKRLRLNVSSEKTRVVNLRKQYAEFLGFKMRLVKKSEKYVVESHMCEKAQMKILATAKESIKAIQKPKDDKEKYQAVSKYNSQVMGWHNYYGIATHINIDFHKISFVINTLMDNRLKGCLKKKCNGKIHNAIIERYGKSKQIRYITANPVAPIAYVQTKKPMCKSRSINRYSAEGRKGIHDNLKMDITLLRELMKQPLYQSTIEYSDNRISLFSGQ